MSEKEEMIQLTNEVIAILSDTSSEIRMAIGFQLLASSAAVMIVAGGLPMNMMLSMMVQNISESVEKKVNELRN